MTRSREARWEGGNAVKEALEARYKNTTLIRSERKKNVQESSYCKWKSKTKSQMQGSSFPWKERETAQRRSNKAAGGKNSPLRTKTRPWKRWFKSKNAQSNKRRELKLSRTRKKNREIGISAQNCQKRGKTLKQKEGSSKSVSKKEHSPPQGNQKANINTEAISFRLEKSVARGTEKWFPSPGGLKGGGAPSRRW